MKHKMNFTGERYIPEYFSESQDTIKREHEERYSVVAKIVSDKKVLDAACGSGYGSFELSKNAKEVFGLDISEETIKYAKETFCADNLNYIIASVTELPFDDNSFDVVVSFETIEHISEEQQHLFLKETKRVLKKDGILIISTPDKLYYSDKWNYTNEFHIKEFYENEFQLFLNNYFKYIKPHYQAQEICSLIQCIDSDVLNIVANRLLNHGKYIITICSDNNIKREWRLESISIENHSMDQLIQRVMELQEQVAEQTNWAITLNKDVQIRDTMIRNFQEEIKGLRQENASKLFIKNWRVYKVLNRLIKRKL